MTGNKLRWCTKTTSLPNTPRQRIGPVLMTIPEVNIRWWCKLVTAPKNNRLSPDQTSVRRTPYVLCFIRTVSTRAQLPTSSVMQAMLLHTFFKSNSHLILLCQINRDWKCTSGDEISLIWLDFPRGHVCSSRYQFHLALNLPHRSFNKECLAS